MAFINSVFGSTNTVQVEWDEDMTLDGELYNPANYTITGRTVLAVNPDSVRSVHLEIYPEIAEADFFWLQVSPAITDIFGASTPDGSRFVQFGGSATLPEVSAAVMPETGRVRVTFSEPLMRTAELEDPTQWSVEPVTPGAALVTVQEVRINNAPNPAFVDLLVTDVTHGATYAVGVSTLKDAVGNVGNGGASFTGVASRPTVKQVKALTARTVEVEFSEPMKDNADLRNPAKYTWSGGLVTLAVLSVDAEKVTLSTSEQAADTVYTLTVTA